MQNLNDLKKLQQAQKMQQMPQQSKMLQMADLQQVSSPEGAGEYAPSRFSQFVGLVWIFVLILFFAVLGYMIIRDDSKTQKQIKANLEEALNTPKMQEYRAKEARRQRALARQRRLRQLGIDGITKPVQKNDLLNEQLKKQEIAEEEEKIESQRPQGVDYTSELAAYNERLKEVQEEEARIRRAQAEALAKQREQERLERERQEEEQGLIFSEGEVITAQEKAEQERATQIKAAQEKAEQERAAKIKAAQEKAAKAAKLKAKLEAMKTQKKTLKK